MKLLWRVSIVNCPGRDILIATMLNGAAVMDAAHLLIARIELCPQPQTSELAAVDITLQNIIILQNKVNLIKEAQALEHQKSITVFVPWRRRRPSFSAQLKYNIDTVSVYIVKRIPVLVRDFTSSPRLIVIRSFDVNKPGAEVDELKSGIVCRSIFTSMPTLGMCIEIRPGIVTKDAQGCRESITNFSARVQDIVQQHLHTDARLQYLSLDAVHAVLMQEMDRCTRPDTQESEHKREDADIAVDMDESDSSESDSSDDEKDKHLQFAMPGGLIGVGTMINPTLCHADRLVGQVLGAVGKLPQIYIVLEISLFLLWCLLGVKTEDKKMAKVTKLMKNDLLLINIGSTTSRTLRFRVTRKNVSKTFIGYIA
ncbi:hypothetical protein DFH11DRAFT_1744713 [Phellopilus nigrolimitatus]|nr:hypothetical protein DFH11DRAFT_1744713 [Phellopilus nigrolimitatus]